MLQPGRSSRHFLVSSLRRQYRHRRFTTTSNTRNYESTLPNIRIRRHTRVIFQGFTGRQATANAKDSLAWGTNIVGGVTPGRTGEHLGLPVFPTVRKAVEEVKPDATGIYVAAHQAAAAIEEAVEAEVPLVVAVAEHIPLHDMLRIHSILRTQSKSRLVGPNSPGIISAIGQCRIGFQPLPCFSPGHVGVIAKSGTLSYETVASTTRAGLGQSLCVGVGGDILPGTDLREALSVLEHDDDTHAIALIGEIGGAGELDAAAWIKDYHSRTKSPKPIVALVAGIIEAPGRIMGHAGAFTLPGEPDAQAKIEALRDAGATMVDHPAKFGDAIKRRLEAQTSIQTPSSSSPFTNIQHRQIHTVRHRPHRQSSIRSPSRTQKRHIYLPEPTAFDLLREQGINASPYSGSGDRRLLAIAMDRSSRSPCIVASPTLSPASAKRFPIAYPEVEKALAVDGIAAHLGLTSSNTHLASSLRSLIVALAAVFSAREAFYLQTHVVFEPSGALKVVGASFGLDDAAFKSAGRHADLHEPALAAQAADDAPASEAARHGIVYIRLPGADGTIGTLVNGAGLAMNTVDALALAGGRAANFLDTGGKATSETVKKSFEIVLRDQRVRVVFVNIFGGLTLGDMIARGVVGAFTELDVKVPVVVRIRGTNEREGQQIIRESGLPLFAFDDFEEAAAKAVELSRA